MGLKSALVEQFRGGLAMLRECVEKCPADLWTTEFPCPPDEDRTIIRTFGRIAFHAIYFTHLGLGQNEDAYQPWPGRRKGWYEALWEKPWAVEPYELPAEATFSQAEMLQYIAFVDGIIDSTIEGLDLDSPDSGSPMYPAVSKLSHELMNMRHLQGHVGQLSELLMTRNIDIEWVSGGRRA